MDRLSFPLSSEGKDQVLIAGSFDATTTTVAAKTGSGFTAAHAGTGLYSVTFDDAFYDVVAFVAFGEDSTNDDKLPQIISFSAKVLGIRIVTGAGAEADGNATTRINFLAVFRKSTV